MRRMAGSLVLLSIMFFASSAFASINPPTTSEFHQLAADDVVVLRSAYSNQVRKREIGWRNAIGVACVPSRRDLNWCYPAVATMTRTLQNHVDKMDGYRFTDEQWSTLSPLSTDEMRKMWGGGWSEMFGATSSIMLEQDIPQIVAPLDSKAIAFNAAIKTYLLYVWISHGGPPRGNLKIDGIEDLVEIYSLNKNALPDVISISVSFYNYTHGTTHGEYQNEDFNWNLAQNRNVVPADLFRQGSDWQFGIAKAAVSDYANEPQLYGFLRTPENMEQKLSDRRSWALLSSGLRIDTDSYEICPYTCGTPSVTIPWKVLKPYLMQRGLVHNF